MAYILGASFLCKPKKHQHYFFKLSIPLGSGPFTYIYVFNHFLAISLCLIVVMVKSEAAKADYCTLCQDHVACENDGVSLKKNLQKKN